MDARDHDSIADRFGQVVEQVTEWDAPTPVPEWRARDVVAHLTTWLPSLLDGLGVELPTGDADDPVGSWRRQDAGLREVLATRADEEVTHPFLGTRPLADLLATVYLGDLFCHTWDLARSAGIEPHLDPTTCSEMLAGMSGMEEALRTSGHYGPAWAGEPGPDPERRLMAFIGRDPDWTPPV